MALLGVTASAVLLKHLDPAVGVVSTPDTADLTIGGNVRLTAKVRKTAWRGGPDYAGIANQRAASSTNLSFGAYIRSAGAQGADFSANGTTWALTNAALTPAVPDLGAADTFLRYDVTPFEARFRTFWSADGSTWTALGTTAPVAGFTGFDSSAVLLVGSVSPGFGPWDGRIYRAQMEAINRAQLVFPGVAGNYLSVPDAANLDITGDIEIVARVAPASWRPAGNNAIIGKYTATGNQRSYSFQIGSSGILIFTISSTGGDFFQGASSSALPSGTTPLWVKVTSARSTGATNFYSAPDGPTEPTSWTQLGTQQTLAAGTAIFPGTAPVEIGSIATGTSGPFNGRIARAIVRNGIAGTAVLDVNEDNAGTMATSTTFVATSGQTVTVNQTAEAYLDALVGTASTPDTGLLPADCTFVYKLRGPTGVGRIAGQWGDTGGASWSLFRRSDLQQTALGLSADGSAESRRPSVAQPITGSDEYLAATLRRVDGPNLTFTTKRSLDGGATYQDQATGTLAALSSLFDSSSVLRIGAQGFSATQPFNGRIYSVELRTGLDPAAGTVLWRFDADDYPGTGTSYTDPRGRTWDLTAAAAIVRPIVQPQPDSLVWRFDANEYPGTGMSYVDPRGRTWTLSAAGAIVSI